MTMPLEMKDLRRLFCWILRNYHDWTNGNRRITTIMQYDCAIGSKVCNVGRGGALDKSMTLNRRVVGSTPALAAKQGPWASPLLTIACALRRETPCCSWECL